MPSAKSRIIREMLLRSKSEPQSEKSIAAMRQEWEASAADAPLAAGTEVTPVQAGDVAAEWINSPVSDPNHVILYFHGGGYNSGSCVTHRQLASRLAQTTKTRILVLDYSLAPEHPFPTAIEEGTVTYRWLLDQGIQPHHIVIGGDSSGGGLVLSMLVALRDRSLPQPAAALLLSPWLDLTLSGDTMTTRAAADPMCSRAALARAAGLYLAGADPFAASPLFADLHGLPPLLAQVGADEVLLADSTRLAEHAKAAGVEVALEVWDGMWHVWQAFADVPEAEQALDQLGTFVAQHLAAGDG